MDDSTVPFSQLASTSKSVARRLLTIGENRLELLAVEVQEERERLLHAFLLGLGAMAFGLLAGVTLTGAIAAIFWNYSPVGVLLALSILYATTGFYLGRRLTTGLRDWHTLSASLDQLRKDRACLEKTFT